MACGMPVVASAQGETKRVIEDAECGVCTPIGDADALSEAIKSLMNTDLVKLGKNSRDYFEKSFGKQMLMEQIEEYFTYIGSRNLAPDMIYNSTVYSVKRLAPRDPLVVKSQAKLRHQGAGTS